MVSFNAIDVETANVNYASICQVGFVRVENRKIAEQFVTLVDPEDWFDPWSVSIHGITEQDVEGQPTLPLVMEYLRSRLGGSVLVCHTAFDRVAFNRAATRYDVEPLKVTWLDSAQIVRRAWPEKYARRGYGLGNVADDLGIDFIHHNALEDARAAAEIVIQACDITGRTINQWLDRVQRGIYPRQRKKSGSSPPVKREGNPEGVLYGETVVFTGRLGMVRREAADVAASVGCNVGANVTKETTLLVVGIQNMSRLAGYEKSSKHRKAEHLIGKGVDLRIISEDDFLELVDIAQ